MHVPYPPESGTMHPKTRGWILIGIMTLVLMVFLYYTPAAANFEYTYQKAAAPGQLYSQRWSYDFVVVCMLQFLWAVPLSLAFLLDDSTMRWRFVLHVCVAVALGAWSFVTFMVGAFKDWLNANVGTAGNFYNRANDPRWCCVYFNVAPSPMCDNTVGCSPGVDAASLGTNGPFLYQLWFTFVVLVLIIVDLVFVSFHLSKLSSSDGDAPDQTEALLGAEAGTAPRRKYRARGN